MPGPLEGSVVLDRTHALAESSDDEIASLAASGAIRSPAPAPPRQAALLAP